MPPARRQDFLSGTAPVDVVLLGDRAQSIMPRIEALRGDPLLQTGDVRIVRRTPADEGLQETIIFTSTIACTVTDVSLVEGQLDAYRACLFHALAFVFVVDLSGYDDPESTPTSLKASMKQFEKLCSTTWCTQGVPIIVLFDNEDIFKKKLAWSSFCLCFPDYAGEDDDAYAAKQYILGCFMAFKMDRYGSIYTHFTSFGDMHLARVLFAAVQDIVLQHIIEDSENPPKSPKSRKACGFSANLGRLGERWHN
ncbi:G-protein alpha subunit-domain-containing protein [Vararia minispora EC-137]|uniref:G-protein alpha subunit-domain-containing protein n=1 Tax=Vararia minispora EC-137 TaxID=1314806 RepID=A0ACB8QF75_9AGAM|nr:G-protein alpha subunit-domain-containing protein [Vararia minispora EC-137]